MHCAYGKTVSTVSHAENCGICVTFFRHVIKMDSV